MKKFLVLALSLCMVLALCVCGYAEEGTHDSVVGHADTCEFALDTTGEVEEKKLECDDPACYKAADCLKAGKQSYHCGYCGRVIEEWTETLPILGDGVTGHDYVFVAEVPATCTEDGLTAYWYCANVIGYEDGEPIYCNDYAYVEEVEGEEVVWGAPEVLPALGHTAPEAPKGEDGMPIWWGASCGDTVALPGVCGRCGIELVAPQPVVVDHGAQYESKEQPGKEPTCWENGWTAYKICKLCNAEKGRETLPATGKHTYEFVPGTAGTCESIAWKAHYICRGCGQRFQLEENEDGELEYVWKAWEDLYFQNAHDYSVEVAEQEATCTEIGWSEHFVCSVCGAKDPATYEEYSELGHDYKGVAGKLPTCTEPGYAAHEKCVNCGDIIGNNDEIPAHGHVYEAGFWPDSPADIREAFSYEDYGESYYYVCNYGDDELHDLEKGILTSRCPEDCVNPGYEEPVYCRWCVEDADWDFSKVTPYIANGVIPATGHDWEVVFDGQMPGCTGWGQQTVWQCQNDRCPVEYMGGDPIAPNGHNLVYVPAKAPTCTEPGNYAYWYCNAEDCDGVEGDNWVYGELAKVADVDDEFFSGNNLLIPGFDVYPYFGVEYDEEEETFKTPWEVVIPALDHGYFFFEEGEVNDYVTPVAAVPPTCTETGLAGDGLYCSLCDTVFQPATVVEPLGHEVYMMTGPKPDCTNAGWHDFAFCARCGYAEISIFVEDEIDGMGVAVTPFQCVMTEDGSIDYEKTLELDVLYMAPLGHNEKPTEEIPATCTEKGKTAGTWCDRCGAMLTGGEETPALGHNMVFVEDDPTTDADDFKAPNCTEWGYTPAKECANGCGLYEEGHYTEPTGHSTKGVVVDRVEPTCSEFGWTAGVHCVNEGCDIDYTTEEGWLIVPKKLDKLPHESWTLDFDEEAEGIQHGYNGPWNEEYNVCEDDYMNDYNVCECGYVRGEFVAATGHKWLEYKSEAPTCTEYGVQGARTCKKCGVTEPQTKVDPLGHDFTKEFGGVEFDCEKGGVKPGIMCSRCDVVETEPEVIPAGHKMVHVNAVPATCQNAGSTVGQKCENCDLVIGCEPIEALPHKPGEWIVVKEPTTEIDGEGIKIKRCTVCNQIVAEEFIPVPQLGRLGDANNDGNVDLKDVIRIMNHAIGNKVEINLKNADYNQKGAQGDLADAVALMKALLN